MAVAISNYTYTLRDQNGSPVVQGWLLIEFRSAGYVPGGEFVDLTPYFRHAIGGPFAPVSGAILDNGMRWNNDDLSGSLGLVSARIQIFRGNGSGIAPSELISGTAISGLRAFAYILGY